MSKKDSIKPSICGNMYVIVIEFETNIFIMISGWGKIIC
jgi:hypothetical protein